MDSNCIGHLKKIGERSYLAKWILKIYDRRDLKREKEKNARITVINKKLTNSHDEKY